MKDKQAQVRTPTSGIPVISTMLHCFSMPVLVFLRHRFGYAYLSPKKIFLALVFASALLAYAVWHDEGLRPRFFPFAAFAVATSTLYLLHLLRAFIKQCRKDAEHDQHSGTSHLLALMNPASRPQLEGFTHGVVEPVIVVAFGCLFLHEFFGTLIITCGCSLALKELIRWWLVLRSKKRTEDNLSDAKETMGELQTGEIQPLPQKTGKTGREHHQRHF